MPKTDALFSVKLIAVLIRWAKPQSESLRSMELARLTLTTRSIIELHLSAKV